MKEKTSNQYSSEIRERAICMVREHQGEYPRGTRGASVFCSGGARPPVQTMNAFIDDHRDAYGVEPICKVLPIGPSKYYPHAARTANSELRSTRAKQDEALSQEIRRVWDESFQNYGARKVWIQLKREGLTVARCTVARLMKNLGRFSSNSSDELLVARRHQS